MIKIKICGITNLEDAMSAIDLGADALGFVFAPSPRQITPEKAKEIIEKLPPFVATVGVFTPLEAVPICRDVAVPSAGRPLTGVTDEDLDKIRLIADECKLDYIQLHVGKIIKVFKKDILSGILIDTKEQDWELAIDAKKYGKPVILAGGLTPDNVRKAIEKVRPYGVDVSSGVESSPGKKDYDKMKRFIDAAR